MQSVSNINESKKIEIKKNLNAYILKYQTNFIFPNNHWDDCIWDITDFFKNKRTNHKLKRVYFRSCFDDSENNSIIKTPIAKPLIDYVKATFCEIIQAKKLLEYKRIIYASQALEHALHKQNREICVTEINMETLDLAEAYLLSRFKDAWNVAKNLENIINNFIIAKHLNTEIYQWSTRITYTAPIRSDRTKKVDIEGSKSKLPNLEEIVALADIHHSSNHIPDKVVTSFVAIAMFAPSRATEILTLPTACKTFVSLGEQEIMGLQWHPLKGADPITKFSISPEWDEIASSSIDYLTNLGASAREAAKWYSQNPQSLFLPPNLNHLRNQPITLWEVAQILGKENSIRSCHAFRYGFSKSIGKTNDHERTFEKKAYWVSLFRFEELEKFIISKLPKTFPILIGATQQFWHDSLFVLPKNILSPIADSLQNVPEAISLDQINKQLGSNPGGNTIFTRNQKFIISPDGKQDMYITSHQFRHLLNTMAQLKALPQELIAFWSGRKSAKQNDVYNHLSQEAYIEAFTNLEDKGQKISPLGYLEEKVKKISLLSPISYEEALKIELGSIHITQYGICRHDYSLTPCPKDKDCGNCSEFSVMKGNEQHTKEAKHQVQLLSKALLDAKEAEKNGHTGARKWIELNEPKLERWKKIKAFLEDESIPNYTIYTLADPTENHQTKVGLAFSERELNC
ncbi:hypothetical protein [Acinetobacter sp. WCHAc060042]|uniref:hypothetical protein n=1 Tax=Acinetobacter sp. WCHAc060042 TaxID=2213016 RepID=UPI000DA651D1|nr:hypothetical protein [Acinetobacter sp. WCHAc060042]